MRFWPRCHLSGRSTGGFGTIQCVGLGHHRGFAGSIPARQAVLASGRGSCSYNLRAGSGELEQQQHLLGSSPCDLLLSLTTTFGTQQLLPLATALPWWNKGEFHRPRGGQTVVRLGFVIQSQTGTSSFCLTTQIPVLVSGSKSKQQEQGSRVKENLIYRQIRGQ